MPSEYERTTLARVSALEDAVTGNKRLPTRRGEYLVRHLDLWRFREQVAPVANVLTPGARICMLGSCFAEHSSAYLSRRGYDVTTHPAGELYNPQIMRLELDHVLAGAPWPDDIAVAIPDGFTHRFRKRCSAASVNELLALDRRMTAELRSSLSDADVVIVLAGTTAELWRDAATGLATNEIPHPAVFDERRWRVDLGSLDDLSAELEAIHALLREHTTATAVYAVCPIPLNATWSDWPIIRANGRSKALLRVALEALPEDAVYLDLWDWMQAQTGRWSPTKFDGRHFDQAGIDRIMRFAERRLGGQPPPERRRAVVWTAIQDLRVRTHDKRQARKSQRRSSSPR